MWRRGYGVAATAEVDVQKPQGDEGTLDLCKDSLHHVFEVDLALRKRFKIVLPTNEQQGDDGGKMPKKSAWSIKCSRCACGLACGREYV